MRRITITSRKSSLFDTAPICKVFIDNRFVGTVLPGKTVSYNIDDNEHTVYCSYEYGKCNEEKSNTVYIKDSNNHDLILGVIYSRTYMGRFKENFRTLFSKGYINVPDIELYENL